MFPLIVPMITGVGIVVHLAVLLTRRTDMSSRAKTVITVADVAVVIGSIITFGCLGAVVAVLVLVASFLLSAIKLRWEDEGILVDAVHGDGLILARMERSRSQESFLEAMITSE